MKRLLLLLIVLFPDVLFGQNRQKVMVDSINSAAIDLQRMSYLVSNTPGASIEDMHASNSDGYVTVVVRVRVAEPVEVRALTTLADVNLKTGDIVADRMAAVPVLPPPFIIEADTILALLSIPVMKIATADIVADRATTLTVPPPPYLIEKDTIAELSLLTVSNLKVVNISVATIDMLPVPPLPYLIEKDTISELPLLTVSNVKVSDIPAATIDMVAVPPLPIIKEDVAILPFSAVTQLQIEDAPIARLEDLTIPPMPYIIGDITAVGVLSVVPCSIAQRAAVQMNPVKVPPIPEIQTDDMLALIAAVEIPIRHPVAGKMDMATFPSFEKHEVTVAGMHLSDDGYALLEKLEGFSPELYALGDGGCTIGFGFFVPYAEIGKWRKGITWEEAERLIRQKVPAYEDQVKQYINVPLIQEEFDALTMLAYNLGGFSRATSIVNDINNNVDVDKLQRDWMRFVHSKAPNVMKGLLNRRKDEMEVRRESNYQPERKILVFKNKKG